MIKTVYASQEHKAIIENYMIMCKEFAKEVASKNKYQNYLQVIETIIDYHNNYGNGVRENNWYDWLMIIPINVSIATNGFFAGLETKGNRGIIRAYKIVLNELVIEVVDKIDRLEQINE